MAVLLLICLVDRATSKVKSRAKSNWQLGATRREDWPFFLVFFFLNGAFNKPASSKLHWQLGQLEESNGLFFFT